MKRILMIIFFIFLVAFEAKPQWIQVKLKSFIEKFAGQRDTLPIIIHGIDCADSMNCFAIGDAARICNIIYRTTDAGRSWDVAYFADFDTIIERPKRFTFLLESISYPTLNKCVAGGDSGIVFKTDDGGKTWHRVNTPIFYEDTYLLYKEIETIKMFDSTYGVARCVRLFYTSDGGNNWVEISLPDTNIQNRFPKGVDIITPTTIYAWVYCRQLSENCPYRYTFMRTYDLGKHWEFFDASVTEWGKKMYFADSLNGWIVGGVPTGIGDTEIGKIIATSDGGRSWNIQFLDSLKPQLIELLDVSFHDKNNGIAVARAGQTLITTDGGKNWIADNIGVDLSKVMFLFVPSVCYRNVKEPLLHGGDRSIYYRRNPTLEVKGAYPEIGELIIVPNPASNKIIIRSGERTRVEVYNSMGIELLEATTDEEIDISELPSGVYFVRTGRKIMKFLKI